MTLSGDPQYPSQYAAPPTYPYPPPPYGWAPTPVPSRVSPPAVGWLLIALAAMVVTGSVSPWVQFHVFEATRSIDGTDGDGVITMVCAAVLAIAGLLMGVRQGRLWVAIVALIFGGFVAITAVIDMGNIGRGLGLPGDDLAPVFTIGYGLWLVLIGGLLTVGASIVALAVRR